MSAWKNKRFWKEATAIPTEGGFTVTLDGRSVKTPAKRALILPTSAMANAIAAEWDAQEEEVNPVTMPVTRAANAAIDKVTHQHAEVADLLAAYGDSDLLCYRADSPEGLVARQQAAWDPLLDWAFATFGARLTPTTGLMPQPQNPDDLAKLSAEVHAMDAFTLTAFHDLVGLAGSLIIGFAALHDHDETEVLWQASRVDETWQEEQWGEDEEATEMAANKREQFFAAKAFHTLASLPR
ncbi:MAG: ATP12 family protein [Pseudomonadota bacterium]